MVAFTFRMGAGVQGDVNRTHPASIIPHLNDGTSPVLAYGLACMYNGSANDVRQVAAGDQSASAIEIAGITVRPYPFQAPTGGTNGSAGFGPGTPLAAAAIDVLRSGYILSYVNGTPHLGDPVYMWCAASSGAHVQGAFEAGATGGSTALVSGAYFNGPPDSNGIGEIQFKM